MEKLNYSELAKRLLAGKRVSNPVIGYKNYGGDFVPQYLYPMFLIAPYFKEKSGGKQLWWDFDTEESYLK